MEKRMTPDKLEYRKNTTPNTNGLKRGTKRINMSITWIFHFTWPSQPVFTCAKSIIKAERHCAKYAKN